MTLAATLETIHDERQVATSGLPQRTYIQSVTKHRREELLRQYPDLALVWEVEDAYRSAEARRNELLATCGIPVRVLAEYGSRDGNPLPESKSALSRLRKSLRPCVACGRRCGGRCGVVAF